MRRVRGPVATVDETAEHTRRVLRYEEIWIRQEIWMLVWIEDRESGLEIWSQMRICAFFAYGIRAGGKEAAGVLLQIKPRTELFHLGVLHLAPSPCRQERHGCAVASLVDPDSHYALNLPRVLTTAVLAAAKNRALRSINSPVCQSERENQAERQIQSQLISTAYQHAGYQLGKHCVG